MDETPIAERLGIAAKQARLIVALSGADALGVVIRAHIHVEHEVIAFIEARLPVPSALSLKDLDYDRRVKLALALGFPDEFSKALSFLGTLRNKFAHDLDASIGEQEANNFAQAMGPAKVTTADAYQATHAKLGGPGKPTPFGKLPAMDRFILLGQTLWAGVAVAAHRASSDQ